jgi:hypothetical protein
MTELPCRTCGTFTLHKITDIPPFQDAHGQSDRGRADRTCTVCGTMYLPPPE